MTASAVSEPVASRAALIFLFLGNIVIGSGVLAPAALMNTMTVDLGVPAVDIGALVGWGAVILCIGAPTFGFLTNRIGRRSLLGASLILYAVGHAVSVFAPNYATLMVIRLLMISGAAIFTPQAASAVALLVHETKRASGIAAVFMGWAVAGAVVIPFMSILGEALSWRTIYAGIAVAAALAAAGVLLLTPANLYPARMTLKAWASVITRPAIILLLAATMLQIIGQFTLYPFLADQLRSASNAGPGAIALAFGLYGGAGLFGSIIATRVVSGIGPALTQLACLIAMALGMLGWSLFAGTLELAIASVFIWGLGFGAGISMQQARLVSVAPNHASASVALNTSVLYLGQAIGTGIGSALIIRGAPNLIGPAGLIFLLLAIAASWWAHKRLAA